MQHQQSHVLHHRQEPCKQFLPTMPMKSHPKKHTVPDACKQRHSSCSVALQFVYVETDGMWIAAHQKLDAATVLLSSGLVVTQSRSHQPGCIPQASLLCFCPSSSVHQVPCSRKPLVNYSLTGWQRHTQTSKTHIHNVTSSRIAVTIYG